MGREMTMMEEDELGWLRPERVARCAHCGRYLRARTLADQRRRRFCGRGCREAFAIVAAAWRSGGDGAWVRQGAEAGAG